MESVYYIIGLLTAGISLAVGLISFSIGINNSTQRGNRPELFLGLMGLSIAIFILVPPTGFIASNIAPYSFSLLIKRVFIFGYYGLFPWFIYHYTGRPGTRLAWLISGFMLLSYMIMYFTESNNPRPLWTLFVLANFTLALAYTILCVVWQYRNGDRKGARWLSGAVLFYTLLLGLAVANHFYLDENGVNLFGLRLFFPFNMHSIAFMLIMGLRLQENVIKRTHLEKVVSAQQKRWNSLMKNSGAIFVELDLQFNVRHINDIGLSKFGTDATRLPGNWFDLLIPGPDNSEIRSQFDRLLTNDQHIPPFKSINPSSKGTPMVVSWVSFKTTDEEEKVTGIVLIGQDVTRYENALVEVAQLKQEIEKENIPKVSVSGAAAGFGIIGSSKAIAYAIHKANQVAATNATILLEGETGVGKELFADLIHATSERKDKPFIKVNCAALPADLIEDELFGHEKGAFTSAIQARLGRFELANGGTIFLDEIAELPMAIQPKLLRVLQEEKFERVGGQKTIQVDVRIIAATNREIVKEVKEGRFRSDLMYRLNLFPITIPPLRARKEDLDSLIGYFVDKASKYYDKQIRQISKADLTHLHEYSWPGNVRELSNLLERSVIQSDSATLKIHWLSNDGEANLLATDATLEQFERDHIIKVLAECGWKISGHHGAAERLGLHPNTLRSRLKKLNITRDQLSLPSA